MDGKLIVFIISLLLIGGAITGLFYSMDVDEAQKGLVLAQQQLGQMEAAARTAQKSLSSRKEALARITAAHIIQGENNAVKEEIQGIKDEQESISKAFLATIKRVREDSVGIIIDEIILTTGNKLKKARIQGIDQNITVIQHVEGVSKIPTDTLPASLLDRFRFGYQPGGVGSMEVEAAQPAPSRSEPSKPSSSKKIDTTASDSLVRMGAGGNTNAPQKKQTTTLIETPNVAIEGDPSLWRSVTRSDIGRAHIPGQGWLKIGSKGPIPGSGH